MISPEQARKQILERVGEPAGASAIEQVPLIQAAGRILAAEALSDVDLPPFEKSMMDGFAARSSDFAGGPPKAGMPCVGESRAGVPFDGRIPVGSCIEIYTGAELPPECDAVEMVERTRRDADQIFFERALQPAQNVSHLGEILREGRAVFGPGRLLSAADLSVLASVGCDPVPVFKRLVVSVLTTGDELVPPSQKPGRGQIREGNTHYLAAACSALGCDVRASGIVRDDPAELEAAFSKALAEGDILITTGGVSVGKYDLVGASFEKLGVEPVLAKVAIKPGKPIWFGMYGKVPVFGLPGNPVSSLLGFEVFVRPAMARLAGGEESLQAERVLRGRWMGPEKRSSLRQFNLPIFVTQAEDGISELAPVPFRGSSDIVSASQADGLVIIPADGRIQNGEMVSYRPIG
jgi:molybdopterin molybdotransferase